MFPCYRRGHQGHSISMGPATAEAPYINASETRPLEAGMILAMEVPCYIDGVNGFNEDVLAGAGVFLDVVMDMAVVGVPAARNN